MLQFMFHSQTHEGRVVLSDRLILRLNTLTGPGQGLWVRHEPDNDESLIAVQPVGTSGRLTVWEAAIPFNGDRDITHYLFKLVDENTSYWLDARGVQRRMPGREYHFKYNRCDQPPQWVCRQVFYQIFPDRFCNGNPSISVRSGEYTCGTERKAVVARAWDEPVSGHDGYGAAEFFGGDLAGIRSKLGYLQQLGVITLYLNPIFCSPSNHKYDTTDYRNIDPHLGSNDEFADLSGNCMKSR